MPEKPTLEEIRKFAITLKTALTIRDLLSSLTEEDLVACHKCLGVSLPTDSPQQQRSSRDLRTYTKLLMFFRSEVAHRCLSLQEIQALTELLSGERSKTPPAGQ